MAVYTKELIESLRTRNGGFDRATLKVLGIDWPPKSGWLRGLIGKPVPDNVIAWIVKREAEKGAPLMREREPSKEKPRVYIAGPYTHPDPAANTRKAIVEADELCRFGLVPFVPHLSMLWQTVNPKPHAWWIEYDLQWLRCCDAVLRLPGESAGADAETAEARRLGLPVFDDAMPLVAHFVRAGRL